MDGDHNPVVVCAVCDRPVQRIEWRRNIVTGCWDFDAFCHGDVDHCSIPDQVLQEGPINLQEGVAFGQKRLSSD